ncbi:MAG: glutaminase [Saprospiraceae bacterium]
MWRFCLCGRSARKSGVGGGIAAIYPGFYSVAVWSPRLNAKGNSILGMKD